MISWDCFAGSSTLLFGCYALVKREITGLFPFSFIYKVKKYVSQGVTIFEQVFINFRLLTSQVKTAEGQALTRNPAYGGFFLE